MTGIEGEIRVASVIDHAPLSRFQKTTFVLCFLVALFDGYDIGTVSSMAPLIAEYFHADVRNFGTLFSSGFIGMMVGALLLGSAADRVGRKWTILISTAAFGLFTFLIAFSPSLAVLIGLRFLAGVGLGGALPNVIALTSEYAPRRTRAFLVTLMACGIPLGGILAPVVGSWIGPAWGWHASFLLGGGLPVLLCLVLAAALPESLRFMVVRRHPPERLLRILGRIDPRLASAPATVRFSLDDEERQTSRQTPAGIGELFRHGRLQMTLMLWAVYFCTLLTALFIVSWLPAVLRGSGLPVSSALLLASLFSAGGLVGSPTLGRLTDRFGPYAVLVATYLVGAACTATIGHMQGLLPLALAIFAAGFCILGAQACIQALAAVLYPTAIRSAGVGWAFGIGRLGSIVGPFIGGLLLAAQWPLSSVFIAAAAPAIVATACTLAMMRLAGARPQMTPPFREATH